MNDVHIAPALPRGHRVRELVYAYRSLRGSDGRVVDVPSVALNNPRNAAAVLAPLIVRKPGAALFAELVAAGVSVLLGSPWGPDVLLSGFVQGAGAELVFAFTLYRNWSLPILVVASIASAAAAWIHDWALYYVGFAIDVQIARGIAMAISAVVIVALGSQALVRSLRRAGVLEGFPD